MNWRKLAVLWVAHVLSEVGEEHAATALLDLKVPLADGGGFRLATERGVTLTAGGRIYQDLNRAMVDYLRSGSPGARISIVFEIPLGADGSLPEWLTDSCGADRPGSVEP